MAPLPVPSIRLNGQWVMRLTEFHLNSLKLQSTAFLTSFYHTFHIKGVSYMFTCCMTFRYILSNSLSHDLWARALLSCIIPWRPFCRPSMNQIVNRKNVCTRKKRRHINDAETGSLQRTISSRFKMIMTT